MNGMSRRKIVFYAAAVVVLLLLNFGRFMIADTPPATPGTVGSITVVEMPELAVARDVIVQPRSATRDLFRRPVNNANTAAPIRSAPRPAPSQAPDPLRIAKAAAVKTIEAMQLTGVMRGGDAFTVILEYDGNTLLMTAGQEVVPGFVIGRITTDTVWIEHGLLGMTGVLTLDDRKGTQILGVD